MVKRTRNRYAFTFLELLVAMTLMNILAVSLYASLYIGFKARRSSRTAIQPVRAAQIAIEFIKEDITAALPPTGILAGEFLGHNDKTGDGYDCDSLMFYSSSNAAELQQGGCDVRKVELVFIPSSEPERSVLVRRTTTNLLSPKTVQPFEEILCRRVVSFNVGYFDGYSWWDEWDSVLQNNTLPRAIGVSLEIRREEKNEQGEYENYQLSYSFVVPCSNISSSDGVTSQTGF
jgi:type II secretion system protein J